jgi:hypothetical protein
MFQVIGFFALVMFNQGQDILRALSLGSKEAVIWRHTLLVWLMTCWWGWQSFRSARVLLHLTYFNFWNYSPTYVLGAQVQIPRLLALIPFLIVSAGIYKAKNGFDPQIYLYLSSGLWLYVFLHYRKKFVIWLKANRPMAHYLLPDYIPIKNGTYPILFVLRKQGLWLFMRLIILILIFFLIIRYPVRLPTYLGSAAVVLLGFCSWLMVASFLTFLEKWIKLPVSPTIVICVITFSYFNNNHEIRTLGNLENQRPGVEEYFIKWVADLSSKENNDTIPVFLFAAEGGGVRSAYWTSSVLSYVQDSIPEFRKHIFALSGVSGGSLGTTIFCNIQHHNSPTVKCIKRTQSILSNDFLSPVSAWLVFPDMLQKFLPFKIKSVDRAKALEYSWENAWDNNISDSIEKGAFSKGFIDQFNLSEKGGPIILLNSTHAENGSRVIVGNVKLDSDYFSDAQDFFEITGKDVPLSTAVGISARFPFLSPPARVIDKNGRLWGNLVDGGYYENIGATTIIELYFQLKDIARRKNLKVKFNVVFLKNTMPNDRKEPILGMTETMAPLVAFGTVWYKSGSFGVLSTQKFLLGQHDRILSVNLKRSPKENLPLGWYLSKNARDIVNLQVPQASSVLLDYFDH